MCVSQADEMFEKDCDQRDLSYFCREGGDRPQNLAPFRETSPDGLVFRNVGYVSAVISFCVFVSYNGENTTAQEAATQV